MAHGTLSGWINQHRRVLITNFQLQYRDQYDQMWSNSYGHLNECPKVYRDYEDNHPTCRLHAIFDLAASSNPLIPYTPAIHTPDLYHICLERQTPSPRISITGPQEVTEVMYVVSIPPLHLSKCLECKSLCQRRIRQGVERRSTKKMMATTTMISPDILRAPRNDARLTSLFQGSSVFLKTHQSFSRLRFNLLRP